MLINGRPGLACHTQTSDLPAKISLHPLPVFKLLGDLSVDTGTWFRGVGQRIESWIHTRKAFDPDAQEERMSNDLATQIFELDRCIECGCCVAACGTARMRENFMGAAAINRLARFYIDPRDDRTPHDYFELIGDGSGVFGCLGLLACDTICPKKIPLQDQLGIMRRMVSLEPCAARCPSLCGIKSSIAAKTIAHIRNKPGQPAPQGFGTALFTLILKLANAHQPQRGRNAAPLALT